MRARSKPLPRRGGTQVGAGSSRGRTPSHDALGRLQAGGPQVTNWSGGAKRLKRYSAELRLREAACTSPAPAHASFFFFLFIYSGCHSYGPIALTSAISQPAAVPGSFQQDPSGRQQSAFSHSPQLPQEEAPSPGAGCVRRNAWPSPMLIPSCLGCFFLCEIFSESDQVFPSILTTPC